MYADEGTHSQLHVWSYRTGEDEQGVHPYGGESVSTTNHHASGVTLTAGLAGNRSRRGTDASFSGAEYDPERPIDAMIAGVEKLSMLETTPSKSKFSNKNLTFDPLVVDNTAELDLVLQSGHQAPPSLRSRDKSTSQHSRSVRLRSPPRSLSATSSDEENNHANFNGGRPKLTDALRRVSFSPKRPRSPHAAPALPRASSSRVPMGNSPVHKRQPSSPLARVTTNLNSPDITQEFQRLDRSAKLPHHPNLLTQLHPRPDTLSNDNKRYPLLAHLQNPFVISLAKQNEKVAAKAASNRKGMKTEAANQYKGKPQPLRKSSMRMPAGTPRFAKVHLPDVTGLTSAVESPAKMGLADWEVEARLIKTLNAVQFRLEHLEEENGVSRRRVRELEYELEECKREVIRERTRWQEETAELSGVIQAATLARALGKKSSKGKGKAKENTAAANLSAAEERYRGAVEEKKALEDLITSLRSHLTRLTSELSEHQAMLLELRELREKDAIVLRNKLAEVDNLRNEVERLAGEVEEGLRERRRLGRDVSVDASGVQEDHINGSVNDVAAHNIREESDAGSDMDDGRTNTATNDEDPWSIDGSSRMNTTANPNNVSMGNDSDAPAGISRPDRTIRTDRASLGSSVSALGLSIASDGPGPTARANMSIGIEEGNSFVGEEERSRIEAEIEERRSLRSSFDASQLSLSPRPKLGSPSFRPRRQGIVEDTDSGGERDAGDLRREMRARPRPATPVSQSQLPPRAPAPTPYHAVGGLDAGRAKKTSTEPHHYDGRKNGKIPETPFPQIRGEYLEKLFFSAPEHDARTCTACNRRRMPSNAHTLKGEVYDRVTGRCTDEDLEERNDDSIGQLLPSRYDRFLKGLGSGERKDELEGTDEGFADGSSDGPGPVPHPGRKDKGKQRAVGFEEVKGKGKDGWRTVVTRVIGELEDDFTHYKSIYCELADRYKEMDAASEVRRRNILAQHLKEVVDILEQKGDQIASLYDLLSFRDKPVTESIVPSKAGAGARNLLWSRRP
ncbi:hypothetical protein F5887DRAFT_986477 [Amanita rubescens]|nr:hypothetical protein F5887DRAFT_986477 [Amanita rubescens]